MDEGGGKESWLDVAFSWKPWQVVGRAMVVSLSQSTYEKLVSLFCFLLTSLLFYKLLIPYHLVNSLLRVTSSTLSINTLLQFDSENPRSLIRMILPTTGV